MGKKSFIFSLCRIQKIILGSKYQLNSFYGAKLYVDIE